MKYSDIKDMKGLEYARRDLSRKMKDKGDEVVEKWVSAREAYSPAGMIAAGLKSISGAVPFDRMALWAIRRILRK